MSDLLRRRAMMAQSRGKTMQLLAEYTVTEPVRTISFTLTEAMKSCPILYCVIALTDTTSDRLMASIGGRTAFYATQTSVSDNAYIVQFEEKTAGEMEFPLCTKIISSAFAPPSFPGIPTFVSFYMRNTSSRINSGSIKIYGEV